MANFGFSISDIYLVSNYAYSVYKSCKNAGDSFREITAEVDSLRSFLLALDNEYKKPRSSFRHLTPVQEGQLAARLQDCRADLRSVKAILHDFRSLDTGDARYRDKLAFTSGKQAAIKEKIGAHSARLQQLLSGLNVATFSRIERNTEAHYLSLLEIHTKLDKIRMEIYSGRRDVVAVDDADEAVALEDEILDDNMTEADVDVSFEVVQWINQVNRHMSRPTNGYRQTRNLFPLGSDASLTDTGSHLPTGNFVESVHNATIALSEYRNEPVKFRNFEESVHNAAIALSEYRNEPVKIRKSVEPGFERRR